MHTSFIVAAFLSTLTLPLATEPVATLHESVVSPIETVYVENPFEDLIDEPYAVSNPSWILIPEIGLQSPVIGVGVNKKGEMDVPDGNTNDVGWYQHGTKPGEMGSAVLDAHVYAAFSELKDLSIGSDVYVVTETGEHLHFKVTERQVYPLAKMSADDLFNRNDAKRINLITCAGKFRYALNTYDHRLVVSAVLVENQA